MDVVRPIAALWQWRVFEVEMAAHAGARIVGVLAYADDELMCGSVPTDLRHCSYGSSSRIYGEPAISLYWQYCKSRFLMHHSNLGITSQIQKSIIQKYHYDREAIRQVSHTKSRIGQLNQVDSPAIGTMKIYEALSDAVVIPYRNNVISIFDWHLLCCLPSLFCIACTVLESRAKPHEGNPILHNCRCNTIIRLAPPSSWTLHCSGNWISVWDLCCPNDSLVYPSGPQSCGWLLSTLHSSCMSEIDNDPCSNIHGHQSQEQHSFDVGSSEAPEKDLFFILWMLM